MPAVRGAAAHQGQAVPASFVVVWYRECFRTPVRAMPLRCDPPPDLESSQRDHARPMHAGVRAGCREDGSVAAVPACLDAAVGVLAARRHSFGGDSAPTHDPRGRETGKGSRHVRGGGGTNLGGDGFDRAFDRRRDLAEIIDRIRWRLLRDLETYICGQSDIIIDYATARREDRTRFVRGQTLSMSYRPTGWPQPDDTRTPKLEELHSNAVPTRNALDAQQIEQTGSGLFTIAEL